MQNIYLSNVSAVCWLPEQRCRSTARNEIIYIYITAIGLTPGGSSTAHIYTQTEHPVAAVQLTFTHKQYTKYRERNRVVYLKRSI
jgi:hypothetical protein